MSKKRRIFDINFDPDVELEAPQPAPKTEEPSERRGPMATAISETAEAYGERQNAEQAIRAENDALAHEYVGLKKQGLVTSQIPINQIQTAKLVRDRAEGRDEDIDELKASIRGIGLSNPIRVEKVEGRYELIQGHRRLTAYRELAREHPNDGYDKIPAVVNARGDTHATLYRRMVDENLVRRDVSFGELAQLALQYTRVNPSLSDPDKAVDELYQSASRQKRGHIRSFLRLVQAVELRHVEAVSRNLGVAVLKRLEEGEGQGALLSSMLEKHPFRSAQEEVALLNAFLEYKEMAAKKVVKAVGKTTFRVSTPIGPARCTASDGRLEIKLPHDFSAVQRDHLEKVVSEMLIKLGK